MYLLGVPRVMEHTLRNERSGHSKSEIFYGDMLLTPSFKSYFVHSVDGGLAVGNTDNADLDELTGYFSLSSTAFITMTIFTGQIMNFSPMLSECIWFVL